MRYPSAELALVSASLILRIRSPRPPPRTTATEPAVTASAFEAISAVGGETKGIPAESAARINLLRPKAMSTRIVNSTPVRP